MCTTVSLCILTVLNFIAVLLIMFIILVYYSVISSGSRISHWGGADPLGGGADLRRVHFSAKMYVKMKEIDPVGGGMCRWHPAGSANGYINIIVQIIYIKGTTLTCVALILE